MTGRPKTVGCSNTIDSGMLYYAGRRIGFAPLARFIVPDPAYNDPAQVSVVAIMCRETFHRPLR